MMMKILFALTVLILTPLATACDETCKRTKAETANNIKFGGHLSVKSCKNTTVDFLIHTRKSLQDYREKQLPTAHRGGARNIHNFITQRKDWLLECDHYLMLTDQGRVFRDKDTTYKIISTMTSLNDELQKIVTRPKNNAESKDLVAAPTALKFDELFELMDSHYLDLQRRGLL